ncbi:response regulator [Chamaesiphon sp. VAR_48_metabat_403]|uniref:response regulator n=1 Tax=Chamaesiphon sp. VAR_48_metabat_403 TaxID=2964700 RepID=UPI00286E49EE|nr:response regulator [Chamaesiphon sp. VAR_48_metabat_403]
MNQLIAATADQFSFSARGLSQQLLEHMHNGSGYWEHQFDRFADRQPPFYWNLGIANGRILYSGSRVWSPQMLLRVVDRYVIQTHSYAAKLQIELLKQQVKAGSIDSAQLLAAMKQSQIVSEAQLQAALQIKILNDLDLYLLMGSGSAKFIASDLEDRLPINGFNPVALFNAAAQRQLEWMKVREQVPSMKLCPILDRSAMKTANLPETQQQRIERLVQSDKNLGTIAEEMAKDPLEVAQMFAKLGKTGLVKFKPPQQQKSATVMIIDDSPVLLSQFRNWVSALGYTVQTCQDARTALARIAEIEPSVIFIDINMPEISGFDLVKQLRKQPAFRAIPLAILTGEEKLSNKWRAQWSGCEFLNKPLTAAGIIDFQVQLEELISRLLNPPATST